MQEGVLGTPGRLSRFYPDLRAPGGNLPGAGLLTSATRRRVRSTSATTLLDAAGAEPGRSTSPASSMPSSATASSFPRVRCGTTKWRAEGVVTVARLQANVQLR